MGKENCLLAGLKQVRIALEGPCRRSVLVVGFFLGRAGDAVLRLAGARAQAVQSPTILCVVNVVFKEKLNGRSGKKEISVKTAETQNCVNRLAA